MANDSSYNSYEKAATAYRTAYVNSISGFEIVVELYKGMISNVKQAKIAYQEGRLEAMCQLNEKTGKILIALQSHLDFEKGGEAALYLNQLYNSVFASLARILRNKNPELAFDQIVAALWPVYQKWCEFSSEQKSPCKK